MVTTSLEAQVSEVTLFIFFAPFSFVHTFFHGKVKGRKKKEFDHYLSKSKHKEMIKSSDVERDDIAISNLSLLLASLCSPRNPPAVQLTTRRSGHSVTRATTPR